MDTTEQTQQERKVVRFGATPNTDAETGSTTEKATDTNATTDNADGKTETVIVDEKTAKETETEKVDENKQVEEKPESKKEVEAENKDKDKDNQPEFKVSFNSESKTETETNTNNKETSVTEEAVLNFLKDKGIEVETVSDLSKKTSLPDEVAKFKQFYEDTNGRGFEDFYNAQKDWKQEPKEQTIREFYKNKYPNLSEEDIDTQVELVLVTEEDEDNLSERDFKLRKVEESKIYSEALRFMQDMSKKYSLPKTENKKSAPQTKEDIAKIYKPYWDMRDKSLQSLNEVKLNLDGVGEIKVPITDEDKSVISKISETENSFFQRWIDKKGVIDTNRVTEDTLWSIPSIRQRLISEMFEQANVLYLDKFSKKNRNVNLDKPKTEQVKENAGSFKVVGKQEDSRFGTPTI